MLAGLVSAALPPPLGAATSSGKFSLKFKEDSATTSATNPLFSGEATVGDVSTLIADNDAPATERVLSLTFTGSGDLAKATS